MMKVMIIEKVRESNMDMYYIREPEIDMIWRSWDPWSFNREKLRKAIRQMNECYKNQVKWVNTVDGLNIRL